MMPTPWDFEEPSHVLERLAIMVIDGEQSEAQAWDYILSKPDLYPRTQKSPATN